MGGRIKGRIDNRQIDGWISRIEEGQMDRWLDKQDKRDRQIDGWISKIRRIDAQRKETKR